MVVFILGAGKMWRAFFVFLLFFTHGAFAECVSVEDITKCARLPETFFLMSVENGSYTSTSWSFVLDNVEYIGNSATCSEVRLGSRCQCFVDSPFKATISFSTGPMSFGSAYEACANIAEGEMLISFTVDGKLDGDTCPDGFYTVPYDVSCGSGFIDDTDVPNCFEDTSGDFCLVGNGPVTVPCAAGVSNIRTSTGLTIPLFAEKYTIPALHVKFNEMICYANLELGQATNAVSVEYNNQIYHLVD